MIEMKGLTKRYGDLVAVNHLDLTIAQGEVFGLLGPNGAGKTTTTLMLLGLTLPDEGSATVNGLDCVRDSLEIKRTVGYLPDNIGFYDDMTGFENLCFTGRLNGLTRLEAEARANTYLYRVSMAENGGRKVREYSKGMRQRLGIADVLMKEPQIIIMDEPTLGLDPEGVRDLLRIIETLSNEDGRTILLSSHQLYQVQQICDRVGIFVSGNLAACGTIEALSQQVQDTSLYQLELEVAPITDDLLTALGSIDTVVSASAQEHGVLTLVSSQDIRNQVVETVVDHRATLLKLKQKGGDLEEIYRKYFEKEGEFHGTNSNQKPNRKRFATSK